LIQNHQFFLYIIIIIIILLIIKVIKAKFKIYERQRATDSGTEQMRHWQWHRANAPLTVTSLSKHVTDSGVFVNAPMVVVSLVIDRQ
jgi:cell division protein FtsL